MLKLKLERQLRGWTLAEVDRRTGISPSTLSRIERGIYPVYPSWERRLVKLFKMPGAKLFAEVRSDGKR